MQRLLHARLGRAFADFCAGIVPPVGDHRPAVIRAAADAVEFVAAPCAVFVDQQFAGEVQRRALRVAVAERPNFRQRRRRERIVGRNRAVARHANDFAVMVRERLRFFRIAAVADGQKQISVGGFHDARAEMVAAAAAAAHVKNHAHIGERAFVLGKFRARQRGAGAALRPRFGERQKHLARAAKVARHRDIQQPALHARAHFRHAADLARLPVLVQQQPPAALADQKSAVRQKRQRPRHIHSADHALYAHRLIRRLRLRRAGKRQRAAKNAEKNPARRRRNAHHYASIAFTTAFQPSAMLVRL